MGEDGDVMTPVEWAVVIVVALVVIAAILSLVDNETLVELAAEVID
ncbi:hypothetical protein EFA46_004330 [Halarchaeum sp. CBA1220]|nr:hypothetical protein [Halarchaeum sp. CBA1220]QLC32652.1 hypothetical protein EFA46_004330 [Halarchaeum sp. CBA1220]